MSEKRWTDDERSEAFERGLKTMEGIALELYRRGREPLLEELEDARARNADMRAMLEQVTRERDEARAEADRMREMAHDFEAMREDRDEARAERDAAIARITEVGVMIATNGNRLAKDAYRRGAEAMRETCLGVVERFMDFGSPHPGMIAHKMSALPIPEEP